MSPTDIKDQTTELQTLSPEQLDESLVQALPLEFLKKQCAIPILTAEGTVAIAMADPMNVEAYDAIINILSHAVDWDGVPAKLIQPCRRITCPAGEIENAISHCYYHNASSDPNLMAQDRPLEETTLQEQTDSSRTEDLLNIGNQAPAIKLANTILFRAVQSRASDIHIEPYEWETRVRFRVDGVLHDIMTVNNHEVAALQSRLKIMSNLNIAERRLPQDGQSRIKIGDDLLDIRVSVIPTLGGERIVLRLLDKGRGQIGLQDIGFSEETLRLFRSLIQRPHGILLLTGPTGSGKTTTLYAALSELNVQQRNILTAEDPVEYQLPGIGQMQVHPKIGLTFANCLRHLLRQDPDVIMIGEIRDLETAQIAIQASLTGHLVLSTLHTNDAVSAFTRLVDMGIEPYLISSSVVGVMAQRLVRLICRHCKTNDPNHPQMFKGRGCDECLHTGYYGRTAISELLVIDDHLQELITKRQPAHVLNERAIQRGFTGLRADGMRKAASSETTPEEVLRVTQDKGPEIVQSLGSSKK